MLLNNARQGGGGTMTIFMYYGVNIWCVRESPDLISGGMFVSDKKCNIFMWYIHILCQTKWRRNTDYIHVVYSCSVPDKVEEEH